MRGFTLPIWVVAAAKAAGQILSTNKFEIHQQIDFSDEQESIIVPVRSAALLGNSSKALGISFCEPGEGLDITRGLEIWVCLEFVKVDESINNQMSDFVEPWLRIIPGHGVGKLVSTQSISISNLCQLSQMKHY